MADVNEEAWWRATEILAAVALAVLGVLTLIPLLAFGGLNQSTILGFGFGYFLAALVVPVLLAVGILWFARRQAALDRRFDISED